ncbi:hypothetical protein BJX96DRAFT_25742 [Aspergillus floccosus]
MARLSRTFIETYSLANLLSFLVPISLSMAFPFQKTPFSPFLGRRSAVYSVAGMIACSQPLAASAGQAILAKGGNAADAAIAVGSCKLQPLIHLCSLTFPP